MAMGLVLLGAGAAMSADHFFPYAYQKDVLPNGLTVITIPMSSPGLISYFTIVRTGSRDEFEPGKSGFAHFFEHMMFRGTKKYPGPVYDSIVTSIGAHANASTTDDFTMYHLTFAKEDLEKVIEIESDRFQNLDYEKAAFQTEAGAIYGEYRIGMAQPFNMLFEKAQALAFDAHPYKHTTIGFEADIKAMPEAYEFSLDFYRRYYRPENTVLLITGDVDPKATLKLVEKYYGPWQKGYVTPQIPTEPAQTAERTADVAFPGKTLPILLVAYKGDAFDPNNRDFVAAELLGDLAFGPQSDLYKKLVIQERRVQMLNCDIAINRDQPLFSILAMVKDIRDVNAVRDEICQTLEKFKTKPVDETKLNELKRHNRYAFLTELDTPEKVNNALSRFIAMTGTIEGVEQFYSSCATVTPQEILHAAAKYFTAERRTVVLLKEEGQEVGAEGGGREAGNKGQEPGNETTAAEEQTKQDAPKANTATSESQAMIVGRGRRARIVTASLPSSQVVLLPVPNDPTISFRIWFQVGSQDDPAGKEGLASLTAAMLADASTQNHRYEEILDRLFPLAAQYSETSSVEMTVISGRVHKDNVDQFCPLLLDAILRPAFKQEDLDRIKSQRLNFLENQLRYSSDEELAKAVLYDSVFAGTPYGHLPVGTIDGLNNISLEDIEKFYHDRFTRENVVIGLGGGYSSQLEADLRRELFKLPSGSRHIAPVPKPAAIYGREVTIVEKDVSATPISAGFPINILRGSKDWYALALANSWLGQHRNQSSHLYNVIRELRGLNYGDYTYIEHFPGGSHLLIPPTNVCRRQQIFELWIRPVPENARQFALRAALRELKKLVDNGMTEEDFKMTKDFLRKFVLQLAPTTMDRLGYALDDRFYGISGSHLEQFQRKIDQLTLAEVNAAIKKYWQYENLQIVFVTKDAEALKAALVSDAPSPITYATPKPDRVLEEDREISVFPLKISGDNVKIEPVDKLFIR
jgi:zinc protease